MNVSLIFFLRVSLLFGLALVSGCCCCDVSGLLNRTGGTVTSNTPPADPEETKELETGTDYAQKALSAKGYGELKTADLRKDELYWYVEGTAEGKEGGTVNYIVMFNVTRFDNRQQWSVQTVSIDGEVVYP